MNCLLCGSKEATESFFESVGGMYDMPKISMRFENVCKPCWNLLCEAKSDLTIIAVQYHRLYYKYKNYNEFLVRNIQMDDNKFYKSNPIFRNNVPILVGDRRKQIENICKQFCTKEK